MPCLHRAATTHSDSVRHTHILARMLILPVNRHRVALHSARSGLRHFSPTDTTAYIGKLI